MWVYVCVEILKLFVRGFGKVFCMFCFSLVCALKILKESMKF